MADDKWDIDALDPMSPEHINWDTSILPEIDPNDNAEELSLKPEVTVGRVLGRFGRTVAAAPALLGKSIRVHEQARIESGAEDFVPARLRPSAGVELPTPSAETQRQSFAYEQLSDEDKQWVTAEELRLTERGEQPEVALREAMTKLRQDQQMRDWDVLEQTFEMPDKFRDSSGVVEDIAGGIATTVISLPAYAASPIAGLAVSYGLIKGSKVEELEARREDISAADIDKASTLSAVTQTPIEMLGNIKVLSSIMKSHKGFVPTIVGLFGSAGVEGATEFAQQYPDEFATIMALNPQADLSDLVSEFVDRLPETTSNAAYAGFIGAMSGGITAGAGVTVRNAVNAYITPNQRAETTVAIKQLQEVAQRVADGTADETDVAFIDRVAELMPDNGDQLSMIVGEAKDFADIIAPIESESRKKFFTGLQRSEKLTQEQSKAVTAVYDQMARVYAETNETDPGAFYDKLEFEERTDEDDELLFQDGDEQRKVKRPKAAVRNAFKEAGKKTVIAFQGANVSSMIHEIAHVKMSLLTVENRGAYDTLAEWAGVDKKTADKLDLKLWSTEQLEKVAKGFETYMMEGVSPTPKLQRVFAQIKRWMIEIYGTVRNLTAINDEVRAVYDSWLAAGQERVSEAATEVDEWLSTDGLENVVFDPEAATYDDVFWEARRRVLSDISQKRREQEAEVDKRLRKQAKEDVDNRDEQIMLGELRKTGIDIEVMRAALSEELLQDLKAKFPTMLRKDGAHPDVIMTKWGHSAIDELTAHLLSIKTKKFAVAQRYGQLKAGRRNAMKAENTKLYRDIIAEELSILEEITGEKAGDIEVDLTNVDDTQIIADIRSDNTLVKAAMAAGKVSEAVRLKAMQKERISRIYEKREESRKRGVIDRRMARHWKSKAVSEEYRQQIAQFLGEFYNIPGQYASTTGEALSAFIDRKAGKKADDEKPDNTFVSSAMASLRIEVMGVPQQRRDRRNRRIPLTLEEKQVVARIADQLIHIGRSENKFVGAQAKADFEQDVRQKVERIYEVVGEPEIEEGPVTRGVRREGLAGLKDDAVEKMTDAAQRFNATLRRAEFLLEILDGGIDGPNSEIFRSIVQAFDRELELSEVYTQRMQEIFGEYDEKWASKVFNIDGTDKMFTKEQLMLVALHAGSPDGRAALMGPNDPALSEEQRNRMIKSGITGNRLTEGQINQIVNDILTEQERKTVTKIWDMLESLYPMLNEVHRAINGVDLQKVEGRYMPLIFDKLLSKESVEFRTLDQIYASFTNEYHNTTVAAASRIERTGGKQPLQLTLSVIPQSISRAIHDITHQIPVRNAMRIIEDGRYATAVRDAIGDANYRQLREWIKYVARPVKPVDGYWDKAFDWMRRNAVVAHLGWKLTVAAKQPLSIFQAVDELNQLGYDGKVEIMKAVNKALGDMEGSTAFMKESSAAMKDRGNAFDRDAAERIIENKQNPFSGKKSDMMFKSFMYFIRLGDMAAVVPVWTAGYDIGMQKYGEHAKAVEFADRLVRQTQPSNNPHDLSPIQRGSSLARLVSMFQGHFNIYYNRLANNITKRNLGQMDMYPLMKSMMWLTVTSALVNTMAQVALEAVGDEPPEPEEAAKRLAQNLVLYPSGTLPVLGGIIRQAVTGIESDITPGDQLVTAVARLGRQGFKAADFDPDTEVNLDSVRRSGISLTGYLFGLPSGAANRFIDGFIALDQDETQSVLAPIIGTPRKTKKKRRVF